MTVFEQQDQRPWLDQCPRRIPQTLEYPEMPLDHFLVQSTADRPGNTALVCYGRRTSYKPLLDEIKRVAARLTP